MIDLKATNEKLQQRSRNIIRTICGPLCPSADEELDGLLAATGGSVKLAVATLLLQIPADETKERLREAGGVLAKVLNDSNEPEASKIITNREDSEKYILCVDAGGSKCAAVILLDNGEIGRGESDGCNV
jgi:N-acetylmuramic acid 6-phosphate etherase